MDRPNIILLFADQMRGDCLGCDGNPYTETPNLNYLASLGTRFPHAYSATPSCIPARASLMTGLNQWHAGILGMGLGQGPIPNNFPHTLAGELTRAGYRTHLVGKGHFHPQRAMMGFESHELDESGRVENQYFKSDYRAWFDREKPYEDLTPDDHGVAFNAWQARPWHTEEHLHPTAWTMTRALHFLANREREKPFFLNISFARPHSPYVPPQPYWDLYANEELPAAAVGDWAAMHDQPEDAADVNAWHGRMTPRQIRRARIGYYGDVSFIDTQVGRLVNYLSRDRQLQNTMFVFASDHGDMLGDHHLWRKTYAYEGSARVPFIVVPPLTQPATRKVAEEVVELRDILPTILEAAGLPLPPRIDGRSVLPLTCGTVADWRDYIHGEHCWCYAAEQDMQYVTDGRRKYIWLPRIDQHQFFDLESDPQELRNRVDDPACSEEVALWRGRLIAELEGRNCGWVKDGRLVPPEGRTPLVSPWQERRYQAGTEA